jgi:hypothetical protein
VLPFRSLDPFRALREPDRRRRDEKRPFPLRTKNCQHNPKRPLDRKSPIQVRIRLPPAASHERTRLPRRDRYRHAESCRRPTFLDARRDVYKWCPRPIRLRERSSAAGCGSDRDLPSDRLAGRGGAQREIAVANLEIVNLRSSAGSRCRRRNKRSMVPRPTAIFENA